MVRGEAVSMTNIILLLAFVATWALSRWLIEQNAPNLALAIMTLAGMLLALPIKFSIKFELRDWKTGDTKQEFPPKVEPQPVPKAEPATNKVVIMLTQAPRPNDNPSLN